MKKRLFKGIIILGIIIIPLLYSIIYLKAFWDPYNNLSDLPIAVVNNDKCSKNCYGNDLANMIDKSKKFDFEIVDKFSAEKGLLDKKYYAIISISEDFSDSLNSANSLEKKQAIITYRPNTKTNYLSAQILKMAVADIQSSVRENSTEEIVKTLVNQLESVPNQTKKISDGLEEIKNGSQKMVTGTKQLNQGTTELTKKYSEFNEGVLTASLGSQKMAEEATKLDDLVVGINTINSKTDELNSGINNYVNGANNTINYLKNICNEIVTNSSLSETNIYYNCQSIISQKLIVNGTELSQLDYLQASGLNINNHMETLNNSINLLNNNTVKLSDLKNGINNLNNGLQIISNNSKKVLDTLNDVNNATSKLNQGSSSLYNGVTIAKNEVDNKVNSTNEEIKKLVDLASYSKKTVITEENDFGNVNSYGIAFAPYFVSLSLWVGGIMILMGLYYDPEKRFKILGKDTSNRVVRFGLYGLIGIIQAVIVALLLKLILGFTVTNIFLYYGSCILISISFLSIILFLFTNLKDVGKFIALLLLAVQLAACGGTFPMETEPYLYQVIYPYMPMTYSVDLLRESFATINSDFLLKDLFILISIWIGFSLLTIILGLIKSKKEAKLKKIQ